ncbi:SGNH/GDSL hydrolase family protein [Streptomyces sp. TP-A0874]|uniref:SGNH/GDSL hydrolase family protein n=1 Tax=Streptomyces sp. TP-A0874 TaxID=549819 RepID=UPI0008529905|nr:SGNH/GDSL hydrolase family protein [Streptomyces sp. TP-A0874]
MTKRHGYALLAALAAVVVLISGAIFVGAGGGGEEAASAGRSKHGGPAAPAASGSWVGSWSTAPAAAEPHSERGYPNTSIRNIVHTSIGGSGIRVRLSNLYGTAPLTISHASVALAEAPSTPVAAHGTMRRLTFSGAATVVIPAGEQVVSDTARLPVPAAADLLVSTYSPSPAGPVTYHPFARQSSYLAAGDRTEETTGAFYTQQSPYWRYLTGVEVWSTEAAGSVVILGDSITDGITSTFGANQRWTDFLATRLRTEAGAPRYGVLNQGISGNRILVDGSLLAPTNGPSAQRRFGRDVLSHSGVRAVVVQLGVNDILKTPHQTDPEKIIDGMRALVRQAHAHGLRVVGGTLMPFGGHRAYAPHLDAVREQVNAEIRAGRVFDAVVDFDLALRDPAHPYRLLPRYDSGDHLHPSDEGFRAMAHALDLRHLKGSVPARL